MNAKPSDFFFGAMEFFAILVPGALLAFFLAPWAGREVFGPVLPVLDTTAKQWVAFVVCAYFLGHLLHHVGSVLDHAYDSIYIKHKRRCGDEKLLVMARGLIGKDFGADKDATSVFYWAGSYVRLKSDTAAMELERANGDSKFFRSLALVAMIALVVFIVRGQPWPMIAALILTIFSVHRFFDRRWGATQRTFEYFVLLKKLSELERSDSSQP